MEVTDSFTLSARMDVESALANPDIGRLVRRVIARFQDVGAVVNPSSRLHQYAALFDGDASTDAYHAALDNALLEVLQFVAMTEVFDDSLLASLAPDVIAASGGSVDPSRDRNDCKARSLQFELFLLSCLHAAGTAVERREPDIVAMTSAGDRIAVAAKRLRSESKLEKNLRKARTQIVRSRLPGIVAMDLSFVETIRKPVFVREWQQHQIHSKVILDGFVREHEKVAVSALAGTSAIGVLFHFAGVVRSLNPEARIVSRRWLFLQTQPAPINGASLAIIKGLQNIGRGGRRASGT